MNGPKVTLIVMIIVAVIVVVPVAVTVVPRPYGDAMDRAADAGHGAECARRRGLSDFDKAVDFKAVRINQCHLARGAQADRKRVADDRLAAAHSVRLVVTGARQWLQWDRPQLGNRLGCQVDGHHFIAERRGAEPERAVAGYVKAVPTGCPEGAAIH